MSDGMRVDLSALDEVIKKLWTLLDDMDKAGETSRYRTDIPMDAFGQTCMFLEAGDLQKAHVDTKGDLEGVIRGLHGLIDKFGKSTSKVKDKYTEQEYANKNHMGGDSGGSNGKWDK
ncbi:hypothetical protein AR457_09550 [Streptomyces agglomeratus]|uniref:Uncharacterized protein n=1 Tax=Streptomyces agglomeratus TaxID=285458 RepID=A0A1E5P5H8_9ACTN|nr:hypothetical protein [Streptomyces agglomeratus]OEJ24717.1 hypothetical protein AS594_09720 [Streptomyces agglomeratus]OEJ41316.1 hypothetical protein BGK70_27115 [Streptomyces agglomeratus]OEJ44310.1 hypothetical protein AR457_09550 [Streptomyces agglomeratus]OEJ53819.1 hypothetical protein BGK72_26480 [Streptomyces agglomeratus]OEJ61184.1 hypothetical protein BGM19_27350 [Streptomyces agglomeratus]